MHNCEMRAIRQLPATPTLQATPPAVRRDEGASPRDAIVRTTSLATASLRRFSPVPRSPDRSRTPTSPIHVATTRPRCKIFVPLAEQGNRDAEYSVGVIYSNGRGLPQSYVEAAKWFHRAAEQGPVRRAIRPRRSLCEGPRRAAELRGSGEVVPQGCRSGQGQRPIQPGLHVHPGPGRADRITPRRRSGIARRRNRATWIRKIAWRALYLTGDGVQQDFAEAARWYRKAADQGDIDAQNELGLVVRQRPGRAAGLTSRRIDGSSIAASRDAGADFETHDNAVRNRDLVAGKDDARADRRGAEAREGWKPR